MVQEWILGQPVENSVIYEWIGGQPYTITLISVNYIEILVESLGITDDINRIVNYLISQNESLGITDIEIEQFNKLVNVAVYFMIVRQSTS